MRAGAQDPRQLLLDETTPMAALLGLAGAGTTPDLAWEALQAIARRSRDYGTLIRAARLADRLTAVSPPRWRRQVRLALLGGYTTAQMPALLRFYLQTLGIAADLYEAPCGQWVQELLGPSPALAAFAPQVVLVAPDYRETRVWRASQPGPAEVEAEVAEVRGLWERAQSLGAQVIHQNFDVPDVSPLGNLCGVSPRGRVRWLRDLNLRLADAAEGTVTILDVERLAASVGTAIWCEARYWHAAKQAVSLPALPHLIRLQAHLVRAHLGLAAKVLVLDLDNTLWGGVIGEDGLAGIDVGGLGDGEAFVAFQTFCRALRDRGVVLAVVSKNNEDDAGLPFAKHSGMVLQREDFAAFRANWLSKSENLRSIAKELGLGLDSFVFFDDDPAERAEVRAMLPEVEVIDVPKDPSGYCRALASSGAFEVTRLTSEDLGRSQDYTARRQAETLQQTTHSVGEYLQALAMSAVMAPFQESDLPRLHQLVQKTNQFNVTTPRYTERDLHDLMIRAPHLTLTVRLQDRFGDRGLVGFMVLEAEGDSLRIAAWLLSCRVLGRTVEHAMLRDAVAMARAAGFQGLIGEYRPTAKNGVVSSLYGDLGFDRRSQGEDGSSGWHLPISELTALPYTYVVVHSEGEGR